MSPVTQTKRESCTTRYKITGTDDEIIDEKYLQLSDDAETWLCKTERQPDRKSFGVNDHLDFHNDYSASDSSCRQIDSRTYTRRKRCSVQPGLETCWDLDMYTKTTPINTSARSSLNLISPSLYNRTQDTELLQDILKFTPTMRQPPETDSLDSTGSEWMRPRRFTLDLSSLSPLFSGLQHNNNNELSTMFDKLQSDMIISDISAPSFSNTNTPESSMHNSLTAAESIESLKYNQTDLNNLTNLSKEILNSTYGAENIAPAVNFNTTTSLDKPLNITNVTKSRLNTTQTVIPNRTRTSPQLNSTNISKINAQANSPKLPLNTTFPKPQITNIFSKSLNNTFTKSVDALNGGAEDDQMSSASDSSFSSCSNLPRSVGDLHNIARLQEESLEEREPKQNSTPKAANRAKNTVIGKSEPHASTPESAHLPRRLIDEMFNEPVSPIRRSDDGNMSDHSERSSASSRSTYSSSSLNNNSNKIISPSVSSLVNDHGDKTSAGTTNSNISRPKVTSRLKMPVPVSQLPVSHIVRPSSVRAMGIRPTSFSATNIPRPASRLLAPRFRGRTLPKQNN